MTLKKGNLVRILFFMKKKWLCISFNIMNDCYNYFKRKKLTYSLVDERDDVK